MILFMGFDIGDAETMIAFAKGDGRNVTLATMPGKNAAGIAIPTLYGYTKDGKEQLADSVADNGSGLREVAMNFKRCPSDIIEADENRRYQLLTMSDEELWKQPEMRNRKITEYSEKLNTFIKVILTHLDFEKILEPQLEGCNECRVCVGHPTRWKAFDVRIYDAMLRRGMLGEDALKGRKLTLSLEPESRAAFLYIRDAYKIQKYEKEYVGLLDIGSSTLDVSVLKGGDARNCVYNDGQNFLGARSIDYLIMEYCIDKLKAGRDAEEFNDIFAVDSYGNKKNPAAWNHMLINCRFAKEALFSSSESDKSRLRKRINILDFPCVVVTYDDLVKDICNRPVANVLREYCGLSDTDYQKLGNQNWKDAFRDFLTEQKKQMEEHGIRLSELFLTGSASRMGFVKTICGEVFPELNSSKGFMDDTNPSNAIANGLSRVGVSDHEARRFVDEIKNFMTDRNGLKGLVKTRIPDLISDIAEPTVDVIRKVVIQNFREWQNGSYKTVNGLMEGIENCLNDEKLFNHMLQEDENFQKATKTWITDKLGNDIANELLKIATRYKVHDFTVRDLNAFGMLNINSVYTKEGAVDLTGTLKIDEIATFLSGLVGFVSFLIAPYVVGIVIGLIYIISESVFWSIIVALMSCPEPVLTTAMAAIGLMVGGLTKRAMSKNKKKVMDQLNGLNLPVFIRKKVKAEEVEKAFNTEKAEIVKKLKSEFGDSRKMKDIIDNISKTIQPQVQNKADEIKYVIESR